MMVALQVGGPGACPRHCLKFLLLLVLVAYTDGAVRALLAGITLPNGDAQANNIRAVYERAGLDYHQTGYVECHGTGTPAGDPTELKALAETIAKDRASDDALIVGTVKTNIGHLEGAAGVAGLIKAILCLEKGQIPPTINFEKPNPRIDFDGWKLKVVHQVTDWPLEGLRRASVNSFGFGGANAHVIVDEASAYLAARGLTGNHNSVGYQDGRSFTPNSKPLSAHRLHKFDALHIPSTVRHLQPALVAYPRSLPYSPFGSPLLLGLSPASTSSPCSPPTSVDSLDLRAAAQEDLDSLPSLGEGSEASLAGDELGGSLSEALGAPVSPKTADQVQAFLFSSKDRRGVSESIRRHLEFLKASVDKEPSLSDFLYTLGSRRSCYEWRTFVLASSLSSFAEKIDSMDVSTLPVTRATTKPNRVCFVFGGQGSVWPRMGASLNCFPVFKDSLEAANAYLSRQLGSRFNLARELSKEKGTSNVSAPEIAQPATTALQVALVDLLESFGIIPAVVIGHSSGEIAAAYAAKAITREQAWGIAFWRGFHAMRIAAGEFPAIGRMMVVGVSAREAQQHIDSTKRPLEIACINSPTLVTVSGHKHDIEFLQEQLLSLDDSRKVFCKLLDIPVAYHSSHMLPIQDDYSEALGNLIPTDVSSSPSMYSTVTGKLVNKSALRASYWVANLTSQVKFSEALASLAGKEKPDLYIEVSPSSGLKTCILPTVAGVYPCSTKPQYLSVLNMNQPGTEWTLQTLGQCWVLGLPVRFDETISRTGCDSFNGPYKSLTDLPSYPWNHEKRFWHTSQLIRDYYHRQSPRRDLVGIRTADSTRFSAHYRQTLRLSENPWIQDHQVQRTALYPAAGIMAMMIEGVALEMGETRENLAGFYLEGLRISKPLIVSSDNAGLLVQLSLRPQAPGPNECLDFVAEIYSKLPFVSADWVFNASAVVQVKLAHGEWKNCLDMDLTVHGSAFTEATQRCRCTVNPRQLYEAIDVTGMNYGPLFRNIESMHGPTDPDDHSQCVGTIRVPNTRNVMPAKFEFDHFIHPTTLDSMLHLLFALEDDAMVPVGIEKVWIDGSLRGRANDLFDGYAAAHPKTDQHSSQATLAMTRRGHSWDVPSVVLEGARFSKVSLPSPREGGFIPSHRNLTSRMVWKEDVVLAPKYKDLECFLDLICHKFPGISVLQVGGDANLTIQLLEILSEHEYETAPPFLRYSISESQQGRILPQLRAEYGEEAPILRHIEQRVFNPNAGGPSYNLILVGEKNDIQMADLKKSLRPDGFVVDFTNASGAGSSALGEWEAVRLPDTMCPTPFSGSTNLPQARLFRNQAITYEATPEISLLVPNAPPPTLSGITNLICSQLTKRNVKVQVIPWEALAHIPESCPCVSLMGVDGSGLSSPHEWNEADFSNFKRLTARTKGLLWVTLARSRSGTAQLSPFHSLFTGLARTIRSEDSTKAIIELTLSGEVAEQPLYNATEDRICEAVLKVFERSFLTCETFGPPESEYSDLEMPGYLAIPRLVPHYCMNQLIDGSHEPRRKRLQGIDSGAFYLRQVEPGFEDTHRQWAEKVDASDHLHDFAIEIRVDATVLGENDLRVVTEGDAWPLQLGLDAFGGVLRVGRRVTSVKVGDTVLAIANGALRNRVTVHEKLVHRIQQHSDLDGIPAISRYLAASHWIEQVMKSKGPNTMETKVLVKKASSAWGQAAIRVAKENGCHVTAVVCQEQTQLARDCGAATVVHATKDIPEADFDGTFDPEDAVSMELALLISRGSEECHGDPPAGLVTLVENANAVAFQESRNKNANKIIRHSLKTESVERILRKIRSCPCIATHAVSLDPDAIIKVKASRDILPLNEAISVDGIYVLVGAFGGLGETIARILVGGGARHLVFLSRSGEGRPNAHEFANGLRAEGVKLQSFEVDIGDADVLKKIWIEIAASGRVVGVVQCAAVLKVCSYPLDDAPERDFSNVLQDSSFENLTYEDWQSVLRPKAIGTHNIVLAALDSNSTASSAPWFLFLSSATGIIGNRGQAAYAAANTYLDATAAKLSEHGFSAVSLAFGPILGAGMVARDEAVMNHLRASGFFGIRPNDFRLVITRTIRSLALETARKMPPLLVIGVGTGGIIRQNKPADPYWARHAHYRRLNVTDMPHPDLDDVSESSGLGGAHHRQVAMADSLGRCQTAGEAKAVILEGLVVFLARAVSTVREEIDVRRSAAMYGVDSLMAGMVVNWAVAHIGVPVSVFEVTADGSIEGLAEALAGKVMEKKERLA
jgi:acyl transferase domain-containing protein/NAD(P)-dependent dehydrogenase (short-subunit alcohol dehydrogenase family)